MAQTPEQLFTAYIIELATNGVADFGLEVGTDPGLSIDQRIQIVRSMVKAWCARVVDWDGVRAELTHNGATNPVFANPNQVAYAGGPAAMAQAVGWVAGGTLVVHEGRLHCLLPYPGVANATPAIPAGELLVELDEFHVEPPTWADMRAFYMVNEPLLALPSFGATPDPAHTNWAIATRFWAVVSGLVTARKANEFTIVNTPAAGTFTPQSAAFAEFCSTFSANAWTAAAARVTNWRKSNHATGGTPASGFARRFLQKMGYWPTLNDRNAQRAAENVATTYFYWATHPVSVHAGLALMVPSDTHHWARISPEHGLLTRWGIQESARVRMVPRDQIAGTAVVVDSCVVMEALIKEGLSPLVGASAQVQALANARDDIRAEGLRYHIGARWFFEGHPAGITHGQFNQRDPAYYELACELAIIARTYYAANTIAQSQALTNAAQQSPDENARTTWAAIAAARRAAAAPQMQRTLALIKGASTSAAVAVLADPDVDTAAAGIPAYNNAVTAHAAAFGVAAPYRVDPVRFRANHAAI